MIAALSAAIPLSALDGSTGSVDIAAGSLLVDGAVVDPTSNLTYTTVRAVATTNIADLGAGPSTLDGLTLAEGDFILVTGQSDAGQNGIYEVGASNVWDRATARDEGSELPVGMLCYVKEGTSGAQKLYKLVTFAGTIDTDDQVWEAHEEGLHVSSASGGEPEAAGTGDGSNLNFDLDEPSPVFVAVTVEGIAQAPSTYSISATGGTGGVAQLQFGSGNAPASGAAVEVVALYRS
jgi:hypothetical protein